MRDARVHYPIIKNQETNQPHHPTQGVTASDASDTQQHAMPTHSLTQELSSCSTSEHPQPQPNIRGLSRGVLLRKEVIQPHLPVRLPCYDFVPIASPTFDGSPHKG